MIGLSEKYNALSSDVLGLPDKISEVVFLEENDIVEISNSSFSVFNLQGDEVEREIHPHTSKNEFITKGGYKHFMQKEIYYQPTSIDDTMLNFTDRKTGHVLLPNCSIDFNHCAKHTFCSVWYSLPCVHDC